MTQAALPDWPRMMRCAKAAAYCDLPVAEFQRQIDAGMLPGPVMLGNVKLWSRGQIDESLDRITGEGVPDWRKDSKLYAQMG